VTCAILRTPTCATLSTYLLNLAHPGPFLLLSLYTYCSPESYIEGEGEMAQSRTMDDPEDEAFLRRLTLASPTAESTFLCGSQS
jgi:hypothetical protein